MTPSQVRDAAAKIARDFSASAPCSAFPHSRQTADEIARMIEAMAVPDEPRPLDEMMDEIAQAKTTIDEQSHLIAQLEIDLYGPGNEDGDPRDELLDGLLEDMAKALEPFARHAHRYEPTNRFVTWVDGDRLPSLENPLTVGDLRKARAVLDRYAAQKGKET